MVYIHPTLGNTDKTNDDDLRMLNNLLDYYNNILINNQIDIEVDELFLKGNFELFNKQLDTLKIKQIRSFLRDIIDFTRGDEKLSFDNGADYIEYYDLSIIEGTDGGVCYKVVSLGDNIKKVHVIAEELLSYINVLVIKPELKEQMEELIEKYNKNSMKDVFDEMLLSNARKYLVN